MILHARPNAFTSIFLANFAAVCGTLCRELLRVADGVPRCERCKGLIQRSKDDPRHVRVLAPPCKSRWSCPSCGPKLNAGWLLDLAADFATCGRLWVRVGACATPTLQRFVRRHGGQYAQLHRADGLTVIVSDVPFAGAAETSHAAAMEQAAGALLSLLKIRKPVSTSRGWGHERPDAPEYHTVAAGPAGNLDAAVEAMAAQGGEPHAPTCKRNGRSQDVDFPPSLGLVDVNAAVVSAIRCLKRKAVLQTRISDTGSLRRAVRIRGEGRVALIDRLERRAA